MSHLKKIVSVLQTDRSNILHNGKKKALLTHVVTCICIHAQKHTIQMDHVIYEQQR